ncbi:hypothetical protein DH2020_040429 [Rehmannia glutinosa]|uniref:DDE Tnp4 domain-containing protein n=1 Tax=Rehmannia glutinosa TaxID=99300 RepID=A0ABR0UTR5_REHGL
MKYTFVLSGWEGSAADSRVLRDAISRPSGLRVPTGNYYLADNGYTNGPGFLTPYRGVRYHLDEFRGGSSSPQNYRDSMVVDPLEDEVPEYFVQDANNHNDADYVDQVEPTQEWTNWRESLALEMFNEWNAR